MASKKREHPKVKSSLHPRNKHRQRYDFKQLITSAPELAPFVRRNDYGDESINFFDPEAVKQLNTALLKHFYEIKQWDIPQGYLCPPIPGRADYLHHIADLLASQAGNNIPRGEKVRCFDIGMGANCIYPIIGHQEYGWSFIGSDIDPVAVAAAQKTVDGHEALKGKIALRLQTRPQQLFTGILQAEDIIDVSICNPPFHASLEEARAGSRRKVSNLKHRKVTKPVLNFGGQHKELWCEGGEVRFVGNMIAQSKSFANNCFWFSSLISKKANLEKIYRSLEKAKPTEVKTIEMGQGNKISRIVAWTFLTAEQREKWVELRW